MHILLGLGAGVALLYAKPQSQRGMDWAQANDPQLVSFAVKGAARPGSRCKVELQGPVELWVSLPSTPCHWAQGDRIELSKATFARLGPLNGKPRSLLWVNHYIGHRQARGGFWVALATWRSWLFVACGREPGANFVLASLSGMPNVLRWIRLRWLREAGLGHLTAVSGLHVGSLALVLNWILSRILGSFRTPRTSALGVDLGQLLATGLCMTPLLIFVLATGAAASASRALLCWVAFALATSFGLNLHRLSLLGAIAAVMLFYHPAWWGAPGFCFSFVATAVLLGASSTPSSEPPTCGKGGLQWLKARLAQSSWSTSWQLFWALAPLSLYFFKQASLVSVFANMVAIPVFAAWVLPFGLLGVVTAGLSELLGCASQAHDLVVDLFFLAGRGGTMILAIAKLASEVPQGSPWYWSCLAAWALVIYPTRRPLSPLHPLAFAPKTLLWVLVGAPLWAF